MSSHPPSKTVDALRQASALLRAGQHARAQQLLRGVLRGNPELVDAHWLLANSFSDAGDLAGAERELRACVRVAPYRSEAFIALGRMLASTGRVREAEDVLRQALRLGGAGCVAACVLARLLLTQHRAEDVRALLEPLARNNPTSSDLLMLYGYALMSLGKKAEAAAAFAQIVQAEPQNPEARFQLAAVLADSDQPSKAEREVRAGIAMVGKNPDAAFVLARALIGQGRFAEAETELLQVVRARPDHASAQGNLSELVWMRCGNPDEASSELDAALNANPYLSALRITKARLLLAAHLPGRSLEVIDEGLDLVHADLQLLNAASQLALDFNPERAMDYVGRALRIAPEDHSALVTFGNASLALGLATQTLENAKKLLQLAPYDGQALTMQADAWRMLGDARRHILVDYSTLVRAEFIDLPDGWRDLPAYLSDLARAIECMHTLTAHPIGQSLRNGTQAPLSLQHSLHPAIRAFPQAVDGPLRRHMSAIGTGGDPLRSRNTGRYQVHSAWSVRLQPGGFHTSHHHPEGWLSSACYLHLPPAIKSGGGEGWLQFGSPAFATKPPLEAEYFVRPEPGLLVLFPSHMWHGTRPFSGGPADSRLTIAFDVVPG